MSKGAEQSPGRSWAERGSRFLRNINILGAVALTGAAVVLPQFGAALMSLAGLNVLQAGFFEGTRRWAAKRDQPKLRPKPA